MRFTRSSPRSVDACCIRICVWTWLNRSIRRKGASELIRVIEEFLDEVRYINTLIEERCAPEGVDGMNRMEAAIGYAREFHARLGCENLDWMQIDRIVTLRETVRTFEGLARATRSPLIHHHGPSEPPPCDAAETRHQPSGHRRPRPLPGAVAGPVGGDAPSTTSPRAGASSRVRPLGRYSTPQSDLGAPAQVRAGTKVCAGWLRLCATGENLRGRGPPLTRVVTVPDRAVRESATNPSRATGWRSSSTISRTAHRQEAWCQGSRDPSLVVTGKPDQNNPRPDDWLRTVAGPEAPADPGMDEGSKLKEESRDMARSLYDAAVLTTVVGWFYREGYRQQRPVDFGDNDKRICEVAEAVQVAREKLRDADARWTDLRVKTSTTSWTASWMMRIVKA